jgi:hypothetical protein
VQVISPYTRTGAVDSTLYTTASMLRTMELLVGMPPMTQFDTFATPMANSFTVEPNTTTYELRTSVAPGEAAATPPLATAINPASAPMAQQSQAQNLAVADAIDEDTFNRAIWASVKGPASAMPPPRHTVIADTAPGASVIADGDDH